MSARERLADMIRTDRGDMNVYSAIEVRAALDAHRAEVLREAADAIDAETRQLKADQVLEPDKFRPCQDASAQLRRMADEATS